MFINYILLHKKSTLMCSPKDQPVPSFESFLQYLFADCSDGTFQIIMKKKEYRVGYSYSYMNQKDDKQDRIFVLKIFSDLPRSDTNARILEDVDGSIMKSSLSSSLRKHFYIISTFDGLSQYYCDKAYPYLNKFERQLRNLVFCILIKTYGVSWTRMTISPEIRTILADQLRNKHEEILIEKSLYEMDLSTMEKFLFNPTRLISDDKLSEHLEKELSSEALANLTKEEIVAKIKHCHSFILWDVCFNGTVEVTGCKEKISELRKLRNSVGHAKFFGKSEYLKVKELAEQLVLDFEVAIQKSLEISYSETQKISIAQSLYNNVLKVSEGMPNYSTLGMNAAASALASAIRVSEGMPSNLMKLRLNVTNLHIEDTLESESGL